MREILFRVWDGKKHHYPEANVEETNHHLQIGSKGFFVLWDGEGNLVTDSIRGGILEQFTGLLDKNGNKIFEGDIVERIYKYEVKFKDGGFYLHNLDGHHLRIQHLKSDFKVIGNIHEN